MRKRWVWAAVLGVVLAVAGVAGYAGTGQATPAEGFVGRTVAMGHFGNIRSHVQVNAGEFGNPQFWNEVIQTRGPSDLFIQDNTWQPGGSTGWHSHPGPSLVIVTEGSVTVYDGDDPDCTPHTYTAGTGFVDPGGGHVHIIRNQTDMVAKTMAVQLIPAGAGAMRRIDAPAPGNCGF
jgi:quercetin dioxygenase-like cupin family protein